jgi:hypothetical protein
MARKPTDYVQFKLRIRESLRRKIERAAEKQAHSANAEAVERIEHTFAQDEENEAQVKWMEEQKDELNEEQRRWYEEQAREKAEHEAALRDSKILDMMVNNKYAYILIRLIFAGELKDNPNWAATPESKKAFADRLHWIITNNDFSGDFE